MTPPPAAGKRVDALTLEQKILLLSGRDTWTTHPVDEAGVRSVRLSDGPHGLRAQLNGGDALGFQPSLPATCFPPAVAVGSSWDPDLAERVGAALGREASSFGIDIVLGPGVNIKRSPLCGRNFEYYSEDPLLAGALGAAYVKGMQSTGVGSSVKHFAANNQETDRMRVDVQVDARTLREIYLPAFERVVGEAKPATVMCAYNRINGLHASENRWLLEDVLRAEWGFDGAVVSDWGAVHRPAVALGAGLDLEMPGTRGRSVADIRASLARGDLDAEIVDRSADRVLRLGDWGSAEPADADFEAHHELAREMAAASVVLLKNEDALPLSPSARLAVIGEFARTPRFQGGGSSHVNAIRTESFLDRVVDVGAVVEFAPGYRLDGSGDAETLRSRAVDVASTADIAVVFAGLSEDDETEGADRTTLDLPAEQIELIRAVSGSARKTVVVLSHGGVVGLEGWHDDVDAILDGFLLGQAGGGALVDVLFGSVDPSGRLAETIPLRLQDTPAFGNFPGEQGRVVYGERTLVGYRWYATRGIPVRYPFGHGLSYTSFRTSGFVVHATGDDTALVRVRVENTGDRDGAHVVQIYVDASGRGPVQRSVRELRAFRKVHLEAGAAADMEFALDRRAFAYWDVELDRWVVAPGAYRIILGRDALEVDAEATIDIVGDDIIRQLTFDSTVQEWFDHPLVGPRVLDTLDSDLLRAIAQPSSLRVLGSLPWQKVVNLLGDSVSGDDLESLMSMSRGEGRKR